MPSSRGGRPLDLGAGIVMVRHGENFARQHAGTGHGLAVGARGFVFVDRQNDGVSFDEHLRRSVVLEHALHRFVQIHAEVRGGIHAALEKVFGQAGRAAHVRLDDHVVDHRILRGPDFVWMQKLVEALVRARKLAGVLRTHQIDAFHPADHVLIISPIAAQAHQILGEVQAYRERVLVGAAADGARSVLQLLHGNFARRKLLENLLDAPGFVAIHEAFFNCCKWIGGQYSP